VCLPEDVGSRSVFSPEQLRRHVPGIALLQVLLATPIPWPRPSRSQLHQQAEVPELQAPGGGEEHVGRLDVQVDEALGVQVLEGRQQVTQVGPGRRLTWRERDARSSR